MKVAALFVQADGVYASMECVDPWPEARDARTYAGPLPVVAHPPCATWGRYAHKAGGLGNDAGCFAAALASVRRCGGVIEHPAGSRAWGAYGLPKPMEGRDDHGGWTLAVFQCWYGHRAVKPTWLYICGTQRVAVWPKPIGQVVPLEHLSKRERAATPPEFAHLLIEIAQNCRKLIPTHRPSPAFRALKAESDRLRLPFLAWIGRRSSKAGLEAAGIPYRVGQDWLGRNKALPQREQVRVREVLGDQGGAP